jgi:DNA-binding Lrp family transcriptional regulator
MSIGSAIDMTSKSVKARVNRMISAGVIEKFVVKVIPVALGYGMFPSKLSSLPSSITSNKHELSETDLRIIKCLLSNPRMDMNDIARKTSISVRTANRRLTRLKDDNVLKFFILCNPVHTLGYIQFVLVVNTVDKSFYNQIVERIYEQLGENILFQLPVADPDNVITLLLFSQDIFTADSILKKVESFNGVKNVELLVLTDTTSYDGWVLREIDKKLDISSTRQKEEVALSPFY